MEDQTFDDYWLGYVAGHSRPMTRILHYFGLFFGPLIGIAASLFWAWWVVLIIAPVSYVIALASHRHVEGNSNKPYATKPLWSVLSFFRMMLLDLTGNLDSQIERVFRRDPR